MRLYLAAAVLMLAFVAYAEAQDAQQEDTVEQRFAKLGEHMSAIGQTLAEKTKSTIEQLQASEFAAQTKSWFEGLVEKTKARFGGQSQ
uniref:Apolipoprotein C1 n=1 Tax=Lateolabrax maculatus TaxID=315492 RepID=A0A4P8JBK3_LATMC|nr:apolipoprotein C1 [Lateolabrax maculatus]